MADRRRPRQGDQDGLPRRRPPADLLRRPIRGHPVDPDRRADRRRLRAPVRPDRAVTAAATRRSSSTACVKRYGERTVVDGVSLRGRPGELVALLGPNGAGKTTTVEIVEGYRRADGGTARVLGLDPAAGGRGAAGPGRADAPGRRHRHAGAAARDAPPVRPRSTPTRATPTSCSTWSGSSDVARTRYRRLSGGERQRLGLALALVGRPEVVILDEPTAGMDPEARAATRAIVADLRSEGAAILLTSHDLADVERLADRIYVLADGRIVASGTPAELPAGRAAAAALPVRPAARHGRGGRPGTGARRVRPGATVSRRRRRWSLSTRRAADARRGRRRGARRLVRAPAERLIVELRDRSAGRSRTPISSLVGAARRPRGDGRRGMSRPARWPRRPWPRLRMELRLTARRGENLLVTDRHPGRRPAVLRLGRDPAGGRRAGRSTSCCPARWRSRSSRPASSTSGSRPPTSATTASSSGSADRR